uniref:Receptor-like serine/threonine-protein kinase n=1 Tax=Sisymbrium irio TaxID=3730 RepID=R9SAI4_SISIR|nr:putative S-locus receptor kinase [Sisymbrium irio]
MKGVQNIYHHSFTFSFLLVFVALILFHPVLSIYFNTLSPKESLTISSNRTLVSPGDVFELGFFKITPTSSWYLGIWYKKVPERTYAWVANRDNPLSNAVGTLKISDRNLVLLDQSGNLVWSTNLTRGNVRSPVMAELLANGNFVLRYSKNNDPSEFLWQSFDYPTDTLLPEMKLGLDRKTGLNRFLRSGKSLDDPSSGNYSYKLETRGLPEFFLLKDDFQLHRSGPWNGIQISGIPGEQQLNYMVYNFTENREEVAYTFLMTNRSIYSRLTLSNEGYLQRFTWIPPAWGWIVFWSSPMDIQCDLYQSCGPYAYCDTNMSPECNCIRGFTPWNTQQWELRDGSSGCVRRTPLHCREDKFLRLKKMKLPDTTKAIVDRRIGTKECKQKCLRDCNCTAFANADIRNGGIGCVIWTQELEDVRNFVAGGQDLYVRMAASELEEASNTSKKIIGLIIGVGVVFLLSFSLFCFWKRKQKQARSVATPDVYQERNQELLLNGVVISSRRHLSETNTTEDLELPLMELKAVVIATEIFSDCNKLGEGGFGIVYKGRLLDGQEIAVKRLSELSHQGTNEFKNEVKLIARLQHINLVQILGCCVDANEKMLIYEYLENSSLDRYLFEKSRSSKLNWEKRFDITNGIARGLLYLHQDSRCRIIHRDLKASNILLDKNMTPKISDFGMARIFARDETEAITRRIVGTYGYMSPEYAMGGIFSTKSDVFSFGVLVLEIVSGKRNRGFYNFNHENNLLGYAWRNWKEAKGLEIVDPTIVDSSSSSLSTFRPQEVLRCIQIGLLCVQELAEDRPTMSSVVMMLGSETAAIPQPKLPGNYVGRSPLETNSSSTTQRDDESWTVNQITLSVIDAR